MLMEDMIYGLKFGKVMLHYDYHKAAQFTSTAPFKIRGPLMWIPGYIYTKT